MFIHIPDMLFSEGTTEDPKIQASQKPFVAEELSLKPMTAALKRNISGKVDGTCCE
jgi:hypothetical protein